MRVKESDRELAKPEREFVAHFTSKQKRESGNHPGKILPDVNMATNQQV